MTNSQKKGMLRFHEMAEKAYLNYGKKDKAKQARKQRQKLENKNER